MNKFLVLVSIVAFVSANAVAEVPAGEELLLLPVSAKKIELPGWRTCGRYFWIIGDQVLIAFLVRVGDTPQVQFSPRWKLLVLEHQSGTAPSAVSIRKTHDRIDLPVDWIIRLDRNEARAARSCLRLFPQNSYTILASLEPLFGAVSLFLF